MKTRAVLNRLIWDKNIKKFAGEYTVTFIHRGAPLDERTIQFSQITKVLASYFLYVDENGEEVQIPFHRILSIRNEQRKTFLYIKGKHPEEDLPEENAIGEDASPTETEE